MDRSENLLPPVMPEKNKFWIECFNAASKDTSSFRADAAKQSLFITLKGDAGYANYRYVIPTPAAGDYTADIKAVFRSGSKSVGVEVYAFDANNKPKLLAMQFFNGSNVAKTDRMAVSFKVPENCKNVRFGLCLNGDGQAEFIKPALYRGKLSLSELPER